VAGGSTSSEEITVSHPPTYGDRLSIAVIVEERRNGLRTMRLPDLTWMHGVDWRRMSRCICGRRRHDGIGPSAVVCPESATYTVGLLKFRSESALRFRWCLRLLAVVLFGDFVFVWVRH